jgi:hypothetical protein
VGATATLVLILAAGAGLVGGALGLLLTRTVDDTPATEQAASEAADVTLVRCRESQGLMAARIRVTNNSSSPSDYFVDVEFTRGASPYVVEAAPAVVEGLTPGETVPLTVVSTRPSPRSFDCRVGDVDRLAA